VSVAGRTALIDRYRDLLPVTDATPVVSLGEGSTPLVRLDRLSERLELDIWVKLEGMNPTGSFKDRGMTVALSKAVEDGAEAVICASTGNTSASAAAYASKAGLRAFVLIPEGKIALGKLAQAIMHGAMVLSLEGNFDQALDMVRQVVESHDVALVNSVNPYRIAGQTTGAFEICDALGDAPDALCIPVGNAGNITAYWAGFGIYHQAERAKSVPTMFGFQAAGAAPLVLGHVVEKPETLATAIRIGNPARGDEAIAAASDSGGAIDSVTDEEILAAYRLLASSEGVFCEPASAASVAGLLKRHAAGGFTAGERVVCILTGHGLKDPDTALSGGFTPVVVPPTLAAVEEALFG
jgi:threonine synthase